MARSVVLLHELPDGTSHYDWLIEREPGEARVLTFRCAARPDAGDPDGFEGERLPDHRSAYLTYEGSISGNRGHVTRVWEGEGEIESIDDDHLRLTLRTPERCFTLQARLLSPDRWRFDLAGGV